MTNGTEILFISASLYLRTMSDVGLQMREYSAKLRDAGLNMESLLAVSLPSVICEREPCVADGAFVFF